ncbi:uncharacterized protein [Primulina huaijiensis]|uniref:uncharacterized protein n=1 Tax=Primulina huaijiensis TaxID=1492673 RepID=UPI003CC73A49
MVAFDAHTINMLYGIPPVMHDEYEEYRAEQVDYNNILQTICIEGAEWRMREDVHVSLAKSDLKSVAKDWYSFISARIKPTEHTTTVIKERAILTFCIMTGRTIDLGQLLQSSMLDYANGNSPSGLLHPSLITALCRNAGVIWDVNEELLKPKNVIVVIQPHRAVRGEQAEARRAEREFNRRAAQRRAHAQAQDPQPPPQPPPGNMRDRLTHLEEEMRNQRQDMDAFRFRTDTFMDYMMDFTSVLAQQFPAASTSGNPFPPPPKWPPIYQPPEFQQPQDDPDDEDGNDY